MLQWVLELLEALFLPVALWRQVARVWDDCLDEIREIQNLLEKLDTAFRP